MQNTNPKFAFTLLEVVVGLVLMATLVASSMVAVSAHRRSLALAGEKRRAVEHADRLLTFWYEDTGEVPDFGQGVIADDPAWTWRIAPIGQRSVCGIAVNVLRLEILAVTAASRSPQVLSSVEVLQR